MSSWRHAIILPPLGAHLIPAEGVATLAAMGLVFSKKSIPIVAADGLIRIREDTTAPVELELLLAQSAAFEVGFSHTEFFGSLTCAVMDGVETVTLAWSRAQRSAAFCRMTDSIVSRLARSVGGAIVLIADDPPDECLGQIVVVDRSYYVDSLTLRGRPFWVHKLWSLPTSDQHYTPIKLEQPVHELRRQDDFIVWRAEEKE